MNDKAANILIQAYELGVFCNCKDSLENTFESSYIDIKHRDNCIGAVKLAELLKKDEIQPR